MDQNVASAILGIISTYVVVIAIAAILLIIATWKIFTKAGEGGWKSLIPIYNTYTYFKISWKPVIFLVSIACSALVYFLSGSDSEVVSYICKLLSLAVLVIHILQTHKLSKSFGHGVGFTIGLILLPNIFTLILGFGKSEYLGPQE